MNNKLNIVMMKTSDLIDYENNPRKNDKAVEAVANSINSFGFKVPVIIDKNNVLVCGHTRVKAAKKLGIEEIPVIIADDLNDDQIKAFRIADNKTAELADWDMDKLAEELKLIEMDMEQFGFDDLEKLLDRDVLEDDFKEELPETAYSKKGDIFVFGKHRLMCGDSTKQEDVEKLMNGTKADMIFTDPPYNVDYEGGVDDNGSKMKIQNDKQSDEDFKEFLKKAFDNMALHCKDGGAIYCFHADSEGLNFRTAFVNAGFKLAECLIWVKNSLVLGRQDYHWRHEPCQPAGTKVLTPNGYVNIEDLKDGDKVVSFNTYSGQVVGYKNGLSVKTANRNYKGDLYSVFVDGKVTKATDNHKFSVRFRDDARTKYCTYLMRRGNWWRVGITETYNARGFGVKQRMRQEKADEAWILDVFDTKARAQIAEQEITCKYGIPYTHWETDRFEYQKEKVHFRTKEDIEVLYNSLDLNQLYANACKCLLDYGRRINYPLIILDNRIDAMSCRVTSKVNACNLIAGLMEVPIPFEKYNGIETFKWSPIEKIERNYFEGLVYSLEVEKYEHYIADGIVVHNCLYGWKEGAGHYFINDRSQDTIWEYNKPKVNDLHPTMKPLELVGRAIKNSSKNGEIVLDLFGGSGSTMIASEQINRSAYLMELDEKYTDVIVKRMLRFIQTYDNCYLIRDGIKIPLKEIEAYKIEDDSFLN